MLQTRMTVCSFVVPVATLSVSQAVTTKNRGSSYMTVLACCLQKWAVVHDRVYLTSTAAEHHRNA